MGLLRIEIYFLIHCFNIFLGNVLFKWVSFQNLGTNAISVDTYAGKASKKKNVTSFFFTSHGFRNCEPN